MITANIRKENTNSQDKLKKKVNFVKIFNTNKLIQDKYGKNPVWSEVYKPIGDACQISVLVSETKKSIPIRALVRQDRDSKSLNTVSVFRRLREFPIIECGANSMERGVLCGDIDESLYVSQVWNTLKTVENLPNCIITKNKLTNHWQIQFYLNYPLMIKKLRFEQNDDGSYNSPDVVDENFIKLNYSKLVHKLKYYLKDIFGNIIDFNYTGTMCRNPYNCNQESYVICNKKIKRLAGNFVNKVDVRDMEKLLEHINIRKNANLNIPEIKEEACIDSRHQLTLKYGREWMFFQLKHGNKMPEKDELSQYLHSKAKEIGDICGKDPHGYNEVESQVKSIYDWSIEHFTDKYESSKQWKCSKEWNKNQKAAKLKKAKKIKKDFLAFRSAGYSLKEIAEILGMSRVTLYSYLAIFMVIDTVATAIRINKQFFKFCWTDIIIKIKSAIDEMKKCKIHWKELGCYLNSIEDDKHFIDYDNLELDGNNNSLEERIAA